jgi:hypothetical protein
MSDCSNAFLLLGYGDIEEHSDCLTEPSRIFQNLKGYVVDDNIRILEL